jgi:ribonucleotide reductase alpha subunit
VETARVSNERHRPLGLGVSGLHDVFHIMKVSFDSPEAKEMNRKIFETIYRGAILASIELSKKHGPYDSFAGSPASKGKFQFDMWDNTGPLMWADWDLIREQMVTHGLRNSLLCALMPTASSATICGVNECFEIATSNLYSRKVLSGEFTIASKYLIDELIELDLWTPDITRAIMSTNGSIQNIDGIPDDIKRRFRTVGEYSMKTVISMAADRAPFVCQSQSMNLYIRTPTIPKLNSMLKYAHSRGLKTLMYYLHTRSKAKAIAFTADEDCTNCSA